MNQLSTLSSYYLNVVLSGTKYLIVVFQIIMPVFLLCDILHAHSSLGLYVGIVAAIICVCFVEGGIIYMLIWCDAPEYGSSNTDIHDDVSISRNQSALQIYFLFSE
jgi:hypothetical protein